tara:strand:+ start:4575 stop:5363 length:789 start_codon:yes stop_codon:yes gene_type:complete
MSDLEIFWKDKPTIRKNILMVPTIDLGASALVAAQSAYGKSKPVGRVLSKFQAQDVFNGVPDFSEPGWPIYAPNKSDWLIIEINSWPAVTTHPDKVSDTWILTYPVTTQLCKALREGGAENLCYLTTTFANEMFPDEAFPQVKRSRIYEYYFDGGSKSTSKAFLLPPAWMFPYMFNLHGGRSWVAFTGYKSTDSVDELAADTLYDYIEKLGVPVKRKNFDLAIERINDEMADEAEAISIMDSLRKIPNKGDNENGTESMLWG